MTDPVDAAINAVEERIEMMQLQVDLPSGRPAMVAVPADMTEVELLGLVSWATHPKGLRAGLKPKSRIIVP